MKVPAAYSLDGQDSRVEAEAGTYEEAGDAARALLPEGAALQSYRVDRG
ncbi:hypothetical protein [Herbiconiux sp. L3-i23]|nr:hypothetical protein [Herbiconiux sp. L3-i23]BDI23000.1 hypothetical protein L3i23_17760 [Herbiconiux sp. L3-i23]